ncbi:beta-galactosidase [Diplocloster agilis]|nr:beta-galactosidase [Diplocloster agilis]
MVVGTAYYPEHWPRERWETDAGLMEELGIQAVRMGEFGWSVMEPAPGKYDFSLYEEAMEVLGKHGIKTVLCTPTATPPRWVCEQLPDLYRVDRDGHVLGFGSRRHYCYNHPEYREYSRRMIQVMAEHFRGNPLVCGWQIDNELGCEDEVRCYCGNCRDAFVLWLKDKYGELEHLNQSWGTVFWSQTYTDWDQIVLPARTVTDSYSRHTHNPGLLLDYARFSSDSLIGYARMECDTLRACTDVPVVHNIVSEYCDNYKLAEMLDYAGYDAYPRSEWDCNSMAKIGFYYELTRGYKRKPFWILEQQSGPCGWNILGNTPAPGQLRLWSLCGAAHGAANLFYFRWRSCLFGAEQYWYGILDHDGVPRRRYREIQETVRELHEQERIFQMETAYEALVLYDYDNKFIHEFQRHQESFDYREQVTAWYEGLGRNGIAAAVSDASAPFSEYPVVVAPYLSLASEEFSGKCEAYAKKGGTLVLTMLCGERTGENRITDQTLPGVFREMASVQVQEFDTLCGESVPILLREEERVWEATDDNQTEQRRSGEVGRAGMRCEVLEPELAESLCTYGAGYFEGKTAVTWNRLGEGNVIYVGCDMESYSEILKVILRIAGVTPRRLPQDVEYIPKRGDQGLYGIFLNHGGSEAIVELDESYGMEEEARRDIKIPGYGMQIEKIRSVTV